MLTTGSDRDGAVFRWQTSEQLDGGTLTLIRSIANDLAFPADHRSVCEYVWDERALLMKNLPEFRALRDIVFYQQFFLNPDNACFPKKQEWRQRDAELHFIFDQRSEVFFIQAYPSRSSGSCLDLRAKPPPPREGQETPTHRFKSFADASTWTSPMHIEGENDVLHMWELPDFGSLDVASSRALGQHDSELLLSFMTVPYLRVPLIISFFASDDRIHALQVGVILGCLHLNLFQPNASPPHHCAQVHKLQILLDAVLFEPGNHLPLQSAGVEPVDVPTSAPELLGTTHHLLLNELMRSPETVLKGVLSLARQAVDLDTGSFKSSTTTVVLYITRLCARIDNYVSFLLDYQDGTHDCIQRNQFRALHLNLAAQDTLRASQSELRKVMWGDMRELMHRWYNQMAQEQSGSSDQHSDENTKRMCLLHAHLVLIMRNCKAVELDPSLVTSITRGMCFIGTRHQWSRGALLKYEKAVESTPTGNGAAHDAWTIPEHELFEALHVLRRKVLEYLQRTATPAEVDSVMAAVLRVSGSDGSLLPTAGEAPQHWLAIVDNPGRYQQVAMGDLGSALGETTDAMTVDVQLMRLSQNGSAPQALPSEVTSNADVNYVFGASTSIQACKREETSKMDAFQLVGWAHHIVWWAPTDALPPLDQFRAYYVSELFPSEASWLPDVFEPVRQAYLAFPSPLEIYLQDAPLADDAAMCYMVGKKPKVSGVWREIFCYRARRMVNVYRVVAHGHRFYRSLVYVRTNAISLPMGRLAPSARVTFNPPLTCVAEFRQPLLPARHATVHVGAFSPVGAMGASWRRRSLH